MAVLVRLHLGPMRLEWCDDCLVSHAFADVLTMTEHGVSRVATWADHNEDGSDRGAVRRHPR